MTQVKKCNKLLSFTPQSRYDITLIHKHYHDLMVKIAQKRMEDYLLKIDASFVDSSTGVILSSPKSERTLSNISDDDILRIFHSFLRGIRQNKEVALTIQVYRYCDVESVKELDLFK